MERPRIVIFGAGNIGRSFIAPIFTRGGYEAVFADVAPPVLAALSEPDRSTLVERGDGREIRRTVTPVRGVDARNAEALGAELEGARICATCVGAAALPSVMASIASAVRDRETTLDVILAENLKGAAEMARSAFLDAGISRDDIDRRLGIVETSIGKMVPIMPADVAAADPLLCWAEPFNTLIVDRDGFSGPVPDIGDIQAVSPIAPWVARKLYIHNFGHAAAAYLGHAAHPEAAFIWEVLSDPRVAERVEAVMRLSGRALRKEYPGAFSSEDIDGHVADLIRRFGNRALGDTLYRVGRDLGRKLQRRDRVVGALELMRRHGMPTDEARAVFRAALGFSAAGPEGAEDEVDRGIRLRTADPPAFLREVVGIEASEEPELSALLLEELRGHAARS